ncbi:transcription cofactor vestigial-like protein 4b isoform X3 [Chiloscyllium punctatum]|nr:transcription cofactor vestigial-like protein 4b isoform X4 [Chiloscyllium plagiosum]XP_043563875.1 transcription cofactor vestigial-like protein 4b isoform X4 [Chiloscyllium plagiosum]
MQSIPVSSSLTNHRTGPPPISPNKRKFSGDQGGEEMESESEHASKTSRLYVQVTKPVNGDFRKDQHRERSRSPIERAAVSTMSHLSNHAYAGIGLPSMSMEQPLALTKNSMDAARTVSIGVERQQNRPSVITCASGNNRNCNLSHCPIAHSSCVPAMPLNYRRPSNSSITTTTTCDPVVEEHFRRSLGERYKQPEPATNSVSITGSVDDHFAKALGETWLQIKAAKDGVSSSPDSGSRRGQSSPSSHMVNHNHSPSVVS